MTRHKVINLYRVFTLKGSHRGNEKFEPGIVVITPEYMPQQLVLNAWNNAVAKTAAAYHQPDYPAAVAYLKQQQPLWTFIEGGSIEVPFSPRDVQPYQPMRVSPEGRQRGVLIKGMQSPYEEVYQRYHVDMVLTKEEAAAVVQRLMSGDNLLNLHDLTITYVPAFD